MKIHDQEWSFAAVVRAFFPLNLFFAHLKHNFISLFVWLLLILIIEDRVGYTFGLYQLFLSPEYLGEVSSLSFMLMGFALGGFIMGFNTYSYFKVGARYPFLTTIANPFFKFCINNSLVPVIFIIIFIARMWRFQLTQEFADWNTILFYTLGFLSGIGIFIIFSIFYFFPLSRKNKSHEAYSAKPIQSFMHRQEKWYNIFKKQTEKRYIYIGKNFRLMPSRSSKHFDKALVEKVYAKNRINASMYELLTITMFFVLGFFSDYDLLEVPAATSIILLFTIGLMIFSALHSWLRGWIYPLLIFVFVSMDFLSVKTNLFNYTSYAYGLDYDNKSRYSLDRIKEITFEDSIYARSFTNELQTLESWKQQTRSEKPKLIILNTSGGGLRSTLWTVVVLQNANKLLENKLNDHLHMITGASGGMIGAAYYRELLLRHKLGEGIEMNSKAFRDKISQDMLNRLSFKASTNDIFIRYQTCDYNGHSYTIDRGYAFEEQLNKNTDHVFDHDLGYYKKYESAALIPKMIFSPTIINDGRRMLISPNSTAYLTHQERDSALVSIENIDLHLLLDNQNTNKLRFTSVMRASATFPFVMPMMTMPTSPEIQLMDAGIRDNYGGKTTTQFLKVMEDWIKENTSGVIIVQVRDTKKIMDDESYANVSFMDKITLPFGNMYKNFPRVQDYNTDQLFLLGEEAFDFPMDIVSFNLMEKKGDRISLSWHLSSQEKKKIHKAFYSKDNQKAMNQLRNLLE